MARTIIVDDPVVARAITRLPRAATLAHSGRSFLEHLVCTWRLLADWNMPTAVCRAGFMHSAYSTSFYPHALFRIDERAIVRRLIGREAEELAFRFCTMDRRTLWDRLACNGTTRLLTYPDRLRGGAPVRVSRRTLERLLIMDSANVAEQTKAPDGGPAPWMSRVLRWWQFLDESAIPLKTRARPTLTKRADEAAIETYRLALAAAPTRALALLDEAARRNPWAAEPKLMRALCAAETGDSRAIAESVREAATLLALWAVPWDKRVSLDGWKALVDRLERAAAGRRTAQPRFEPICAALAGRARRPRWLV